MAVYDNSPDFHVDYSCHYHELVMSAAHIMDNKFRLVNIKKPLKFLDIGCSEGIYVAAAKALGWQAAGIEIDSSKAERAIGRGLDVQLTDIFKYSEYPTCYDFILLRHVIEHVPDFLSFIKAASKLVSKDGILCIETPNQSSFISLVTRNRLVDGRYMGTLYPPTHIHAFEKKCIRKISEVLGLNLVRITTYAPSDPEWQPPLMYKKKSIKSVAHGLFARFGCGNDIAAFFRLPLVRKF
jgi:2-polyprenyl-3-methyl-5-hydroxy-6-metoxy-1,4-benzoquinol methylase